MQYATHYDVGDRKRTNGINEDSVAIAVFEEGHRDGFRGQTRPAGRGSDAEGETDERPGPPANRAAAAFALADGAGGHEAGDVASYIATTVACEHLSGMAVRAARSDPGAFDVGFEDPLPAATRAGDLESAVAEAIVAAHREVLEYAADSDREAHTTIVAGISVGGQLHYGWVGDSRAYVVNARHDSITRLTKDHAVVERLSDAGHIDDVEAMVHPRGNEITRALGGNGNEDPENATVQVETDTVPVYAEDLVLVTSDGLVDAQTEAAKLHEWYLDADRDDEMAQLIRDRSVTDGEIRDCVLASSSMPAAAADLVEMANARGGKDNLSTVLFRDGTLPETPANPPDRSVAGEAAVEDRQTLLNDD